MNLKSMSIDFQPAGSRRRGAERKRCRSAAEEFARSDAKAWPVGDDCSARAPAYFQSVRIDPMTIIATNRYPALIAKNLNGLCS
jgi:hypothetical protein